MAEKYKIIVKVVKQEGRCSAGHKVGDEIAIGPTPKTPEGGMCAFAFMAIFPQVCAMMTGGKFSWQENSDAMRAQACPDNHNPVLFDLRRVPVD